MARWLLVAMLGLAACIGTVTEPGADDPGRPDASGDDDDDDIPDGSPVVVDSGPPDATVTYDAEPTGTNPAAPRLIPGGGVADAPVGGTLNVYVIDQRTGAAIAGAGVRVGSASATTDASGLHVFSDAALTGRQTVTASATGYVPATWVGVAGANLTLPLVPGVAPAVATVSGTISGWDALPAPSGFTQYNLGLVLYTFVDDINAAENSIPAPLDGTTPANTCIRTALSNACAWKMNARTGKQLHYAVIVRGETKGTSDTADDTYTLLGYAVGQISTLTAGQNVSGETLTMVSAGAQTGLAVSFSGAPAGLGNLTAVPMIHLGDVGRVMLPLPVMSPSVASTKIPALEGAFAGGRAEVVTIAAPPGGAKAPFSVACARAVTGGTATPGNYPAPPTGLSGGATLAFTPVQGASLHLVALNGADGKPRWNLVVLDDSSSIALPALTPDPLPSGTLTLQVTATFVPGFAQSAFDLPTVTSTYTHASGAQATFSH
jgi:hypothetical protein